MALFGPANRILAARNGGPPLASTPHNLPHDATTGSQGVDSSHVNLSSEPVHLA